MFDDFWRETEESSSKTLENPLPSLGHQHEMVYINHSRSCLLCCICNKRQELMLARRYRPGYTL